MQFAPMKPTLKSPETKRLNLKYDNLLSKFAFNFNLRRYIVGYCCTRMDLVAASRWWT